MQVRNIDISIIICCYNSENRIVPTLEHLSKQSLGQLSCEIVLVDNNCSDGTIELAKKTWDSIGNPFELKFVEEKEPGLSYARKCGVFEARGEIIVFCDDDNWLKDDFLTTGYSIMKSNKSIGVLGGQGIPVCQGEIPKWFSTFQGSYAVGYQSLYSGDISSRGYVWGAGCFLRKRDLICLYKAGFTNLCTDRKGVKLSSGGDSELSKWHLLIGQKLWFEENLIFQHYIETSRLNKDYLEGLTQGFIESSQYLSIYDNLMIYQKSSIYQKFKIEFYGIIRLLKAYNTEREIRRIKRKILKDIKVFNMLKKLSSNV